MNYDLEDRYQKKVGDFQTVQPRVSIEASAQKDDMNMGASCKPKGNRISQKQLSTY